MLYDLETDNLLFDKICLCKSEPDKFLNVPLVSTIKRYF